MCAVSFWGLQPQRRRLCMFRQSNDPVALSVMTNPWADGPLSFRLLILFSICPYQLPPTPYSRQLLFMLTVYGVFPSVVYVFF